MTKTKIRLPQKLLDDLAKGRVVLVAGTGLSVGGKNKYGHDIVGTKALATILAEAAGFDYKDEPLRKVMNAARPKIGIKSFQLSLEPILLVANRLLP